jgi:nucleotide-binding universal stress UspA family protein
MSSAEKSWVSFDRVLCAIDFSPSSFMVLPFAASIARHYGGELFLAHVVPAEDSSTSVPPTSHVAVDQALTQASVEKRLNGMLANLCDIPHEVHLDYGGVSQKLSAIADKCDVDLIVIGSHGFQGIRKLLLGSIAEEIVRSATRPVLTIGPCVTGGPEFKRILFVTDFSAAAVRAVPYAFSLAHTRAASLCFLHVNDWDSGEPPAEAKPKTLEFVREHAGKHGFNVLGGQSEVMVEFGPRVGSILEIARHREIDLIIMGERSSNSRMAGVAAHLSGLTAYDLISHAHCPVLTVHATGESVQ